MPPGSGRAELVFHLELTGQTEFHAQCRLSERCEWPVVFSVRLFDSERSVMEECTTVSPGQALDLRLDVPAREGSYRLALGTEMLSTARTNGFAWAHWARVFLR
jgi:hypothetical protein